MNTFLPRNNKNCTSLSYECLLFVGMVFWEMAHKIGLRNPNFPHQFNMLKCYYNELVTSSALQSFLSTNNL